MLAAIYTRVSTSDQAENGTSLADQERRCRELVRAAGVDDVVVFSDPGMSGSELDRPGLSRLRDAVRTGSVHMVVALDPDRLSRVLAHQLLITDEIEGAGATLSFVDFEWKQGPEGRLFYAVRGAIAEYERFKIRERTLRGREAAAREGRIIASGGWYGYRRSKDGPWERDPETSAIVERIYRYAAVDRLTPSRIAAALVRDGIPSPRGGFWSAKMIRRVLTNPVYRGVVYNFRSRHRFGDRSGWPRAMEAAPDVIPAAIQPIVSVDLWEAARATLRDEPPGARGKAKAIYLLTGLVRCGCCNGRLTPTSTVFAGTRYRYYKCSLQDASRKAIPPEHRCRQRRVRADDLESIVWTETLRVLNHPERLLEVLEDDEGTRAAEQEAGRLRDQVTWWEGKRQRTVEAFAMGWLSKADAESAVRKATEETERLSTALRAIQGGAAFDVAAARQQIHAYCAGLLAQADAAEPDVKARLVAMLWERVVVTDAQVRLVGRFDSGALEGRPARLTAAESVPAPYTRRSRQVGGEAPT